MKKAYLILAVGIAALLTVNGSAAENLLPDKKADIKKLLEVTGSLKIAKNMSEAVVNQMSRALKQARPDVPPETFDIIHDEVNKTISEAMVAKGGFIDLMIVLYHRYYTHADIKGLLAFFQSPLGRKASSLGPVMSQEGFAIGQRWGESLGPIIDRRVRARIRDKGIEI